MASFIIDSVNTETFASQILGQGVMIENFEYEHLTAFDEFETAVRDATVGGQSLGAVLGAVEVNITPEYRIRNIAEQVAVIPFVGQNIIDRWDVTMSATLVEFDADKIRHLFPTAEPTEVSTDITNIKIRTALNQSDHVINHTWVVSTDYGYMMVALKNALGGTTGAITGTPRDEGTVAFQTTGHVADLRDISYVPADIWLIKRDGGAIIQGAVSGLQEPTVTELPTP
jgi:hypothetical protein